MHPPLRGHLHGPARQVESKRLDHLVIVEPPRVFLAPHQPRLTEGEEQVMGIDEIEGSESFSGQHV
jgi:hypothetical protein